MTRRALACAAALLALGLVFRSAWGHARMVFPTPRTDADDLKVGPCGDVPPTQSPNVFEPGATITVSFEETILHPGHFRIAFSPANDEAFDDYVLADDIPLIRDGTPRPIPYTVPVTLPNMECEGCTLQLIQCMTEGGQCSNYYACADLALRAAAADGGLGDGGPPGLDGGAGDAGMGSDGGGDDYGAEPGLCSVAAGGSTSSPTSGWLFVISLLSVLLYRTRTYTGP